jgi:hypothetical protein
MALMRYLDYHPDQRDKLMQWGTLGWLLLVIIGLALVIHSTVRHHYGSALIGLAFGVVAAAWGRDVLDGIKLETLGLMLLMLVWLVVLWFVLVPDWSATTNRLRAAIRP